MKPSLESTLISPSQIVSAEVLDVIYDDANPNLIYGIKAKILDSNIANSASDPNVITAKPINYNYIRIPIVGEIVLLIKAASSYSTGTRATSDTYYIDIVSLQSSIHHNGLPEVTKKEIQQGQASGNSTSYTEASSGNGSANTRRTLDENFSENPLVKPLQNYIGDTLITGRYGQSIRFSTTPKSGKFTVNPRWSSGTPGAPITIIRNTRQQTDTKKVNDFVSEDFTNDDVTLILSSGQELEFEQSSKQLTAADSKNINTWKSEKWGSTPQALLTAGRIIFNSSQNEIIAFAKKGIALSSETNITADASDTITLNSSTIELGNDADEPLLLGNKWKQWTENFFTTLGTLTVITPAGPSSPLTASPQWAQLEALKAQLPLILSDLAFTKKTVLISPSLTNQTITDPTFTLTMNDQQELTNQADVAAQDSIDPALTPPQQETAAEYEQFVSSQLEEGQSANESVDYELEEDEIVEDAKTNNTYIPESNAPESTMSTPIMQLESNAVNKGVLAVQAALLDVGQLEQPIGSNYGGRVTEMLRTVGINGPAYWCAAAVATWWKSAGMEIPPGAAACRNWVSWAKARGRWSTTPVVGAAAIYANSAGIAHHIGIVAVANSTSGRIVTIEGNTSGAGFSRNGVGVFKKTPRLTSVLGFVLPG